MGLLVVLRPCGPVGRSRRCVDRRIVLLGLERYSQRIIQGRGYELQLVLADSQVSRYARDGCLDAVINFRLHPSL
jgi:hypothetical protein